MGEIEDINFFLLFDIEDMKDIEEMEIIFYPWREIKNIDNLNFGEKYNIVF